MTPKVEGLSGESGDDSSSGSSSSRRLAKNTDEYRRRRERNNQAVKKSRQKSKLKTQQMMERVTQLKGENEELEENIKILTKELSVLKDLYVAHAGNAHGVRLCEAELSRMLCDDSEMDEAAALLMGLSQAPPP
ncbi:CCAAT/enhancer-binding protein gamma-like [Penaeus chinensis]|uniref:CCAAT/enhancer-binding protein gamma-like n=1 Tax=Penaeus chinensis TaxID=139456 RepID=UPI001FB6899A|nr:CCAAT/enhancer-binding protein gamma-like [Penaeus chinensis]XP_047470415.1 CCAAT/enhancer-binding protein gamma-like [Penaeus chinensis]XP_047470416.1 CCAAT/enhancer-binding protein gamma-like [Penaeus chinensis]